MKKLSLLATLLITATYTTTVFADENLDAALERDYATVEVLGGAAAGYGATKLMLNSEGEFERNISKMNDEIKVLRTEQMDQLAKHAGIRESLENFIQNDSEVKRLSYEAKIVKENREALLIAKENVDLNIAKLRENFFTGKNIPLYKTHSHLYMKELENTPAFVKAQSEKIELNKKIKKITDTDNDLARALTRAKALARDKWQALNPSWKNDLALAQDAGIRAEAAARKIEKGSLVNTIQVRKLFRVIYFTDMAASIGFVAHGATKFMNPNMIDSSNWSKKIESGNHQQMVNEATLADMAK